MRTIWWDPDQQRVLLLDQTKLPLETRIISCDSFHQLKQAICEMKIRGAPALAAAAGLAMVLALKHAQGDPDQLKSQLNQCYRELIATRPTAVNLELGATRVLEAALKAPTKDQMIQNAIWEAIQIMESDLELNRAISELGSSLIEQGDGVLTHCNAGALACVDIGTALGIIKAAHAKGIRFRVYITETRPWNQGSRLSAHELLKAGIVPKLIVDSAAGYLMSIGQINKVLVGADRIVRDGIFNKIGTYMLAVLANYHGIPFYVAAPTTSLDLSRSRDQVLIEQRAPSEITQLQGIRLAPHGVDALNLAFDFTPFQLVNAIITQHGIFTPQQLIQRYSQH